MICRADTVGVFQIESRAQMSMLPRLKPRCYYDLVVEVAIVRPGPIQGGMVHPYLKNRTLRDDEIDCPEELKPALVRTKGVPIFQEQVMQIAMLAADFTAGEADALRRAMAAWKRRGGLSPFHKRLVGRMVEKGYAPEYAERIFKQIQGFGEYGFPESHAAGFALLAYVSSWIKCHHPDAFLCGLLNSQPMGFYAPAQLVRDAREHGVEVRPVDVAVSGWESTLEGAHAGSRRQAARAAARRGRPLRQPCASASTASAASPRRRRAHRRRARRGALRQHRRPGAARPPRRAALAALAEADALQGLTGHRHQAAWAVAGIDTRPTEMLRATRAREAAVALAAPSEGEETLADYRALGLTLKRHPLALLRAQLAAFRVEPAARLRTYPHGRLARASGLVTHRQRPETAKGTVFVTLEDETGAVNVIVWPQVAEAQRKPLLGATLLTVYGQWQRQGEGDGGDAPGRDEADRPLAAAEGAGQPQPRFPLSRRRRVAALRRRSRVLQQRGDRALRQNRRMRHSRHPRTAAVDHRPGDGRPSARGRPGGDEGERLVRDAVAALALATATPRHADEARRRDASPRGARRRPVPGPLIDAGRPRVRAGDREVRVVMAMRRPRVVVFGGLLSADECDELIALARARLARSETVETRPARARSTRRAPATACSSSPASSRSARASRRASPRCSTGRSRTARGCRSCATGRAPSTSRTTTTSIRPSRARRRSSSAAASASPRSSAT